MKSDGLLLPLPDDAYGDPERIDFIRFLVAAIRTVPTASIVTGTSSSRAFAAVTATIGPPLGPLHDSARPMNQQRPHIPTAAFRNPA